MTLDQAVLGIWKEIFQPDVIRIGSWNIKDSGGNDTPMALEIIFEIMSGKIGKRFEPYHFFAVQEVVGKKWYGDIRRLFAKYGIPYNSIQVYSGHKHGQKVAEYYTLFYDRRHVTIIGYELFHDYDDEFPRPPLLIHAKIGKGKTEWEGVLVVGHSSYREGKAQDQLDNLATKVVRYIKNKFRTPNIIVAADLNLIPPYIMENELLEREIEFEMEEPLDFPGNRCDTTVFGKEGPQGAIDHFIIDGKQIQAFSYSVGRWDLPLPQRIRGIFDRKYRRRKMLEISDHWPHFLAIYKTGPTEEYGRLAQGIIRIGRSIVSYLNGARPYKLQSRIAK